MDDTQDMVLITGASLDEARPIAAGVDRTLGTLSPQVRLCAVTLVMMTFISNEARWQGASTDEIVDCFADGLKQSLNALDTEGTA